MVIKGNLSFISILFGTLLAGGLLNWTFGLAYGDTNLQFAISGCPVLSNGVDEESGQCPDIKTIQNEGERIGNEHSISSTPQASGPVNPFAPLRGWD
jgi:hypothetical protein